jgi:hypothetical protein
MGCVELMYDDEGRLYHFALCNTNITFTAAVAPWENKNGFERDCVHYNISIHHYFIHIVLFQGTFDIFVYSAKNTKRTHTSYYKTKIRKKIYRNNIIISKHILLLMVRAN